MKLSGVLHPELLEVLAAAGHGDVIVLADAGLKIPHDRYRIDVGVACGVPSMAQVLEAVSQELVIEDAIVATEFADWNPDVHAAVLTVLDVEPSDVPHVDLMADLAERAYCYVKTGECTAYSSVALVCGVNYMQQALDLHAKLHPDED